MLVLNFLQEMAAGVVGTFKDHRSLALTLQDSEHIARKLGLIIMGVILFILMVSMSVNIIVAVLKQAAGGGRKSMLFRGENAKGLRTHMLQNTSAVFTRAIMLEYIQRSFHMSDHASRSE